MKYCSRSSDLRQTGRLGVECLGAALSDTTFDRCLVYEAALAAVCVFERYEERKADADEDGEEPECRTPVEGLRERTTEYWSK